MQIKTEYPRVQLSGWRVWPLAALFNYAFVPLHLRVLFINCVALCWTTYLLMRAKSMAKQAAAAAGTWATGCILCLKQVLACATTTLSSHVCQLGQVKQRGMAAGVDAQNHQALLLISRCSSKRWLL
jgi:hypothetical protein